MSFEHRPMRQQYMEPSSPSTNSPCYLTWVSMIWPVTDQPFHCYVSGWWHDMWTLHPCQHCKVVTKYLWLPSLTGPHKLYYDVILSLEWSPASVPTLHPPFSGGREGWRDFVHCQLKNKTQCFRSWLCSCFQLHVVFLIIKWQTKSNNRRVLWDIIHNHQSSTLPTCPAGIACVQHTCSLHHVISMVHSHGTALYGCDLEDKVTLPWFQHVHIFNIYEWFTYLNLQQTPKQCQV